jgi:hypothetical protein
MARCKCDDAPGHARAVESSIFQCLMNALNDPSRETYWRNKADTLEQKFTTEHGRHYSDFIHTTTRQADGR